MPRVEQQTSSSSSDKTSNRWPRIHAPYQQHVILNDEHLELLLTGYKTVPMLKYLVYLVYFLSVGIMFLIFRWFPRLEVTSTSKRVPLKEANVLIVETSLGQLEVLSVSEIPFNEQKYHLFPSSTNSSEALPVIRAFDYHHLKFVFHPDEEEFVTIRSWKPSEWSHNEKVLAGINENEASIRRVFVGINLLEIDNPSNLQLIINEALNPFYIFQVFSVIVWCFEAYYTFAAAIVVISAVGIGTTLIQIRRNIDRMVKMCRFLCDVKTFRDKKWTTLSSDQIVPGDIIDITDLDVFPCDVILLEGDCIVNESMLTGESLPVHKKAINIDMISQIDRADTNLASATSKHCLFNGTKNIRVRSEDISYKFEKGRVSALVIRTGFDTLKGSLVRSMLFPRPNKFKFYEDSLKFVGVLALISVVGFIASIFVLSNLGVTADKIALRALDLITIVVPPSLPASLTIGMNIALNRLRQLGVYCINPPRVNIGGRVDIVCFDKTGTLTEDGLDVLGIRANNEDSKLFDEIAVVDLNTQIKNQNELYEELLYATASCHSIKLAHDQLIGDPLDLKMFEYSKWSLKEHLMAGILPEDPSTPVVIVTSPVDEYNKLFVFHEFEFVSSLRRMSVIVGKDQNELSVICKGAPESLVPLCQPTSLPRDFDGVLDDYTRSGFRVIAFASKTLKVGDNWRNMKREEVESDLKFIGFIVFENKLKTATAGAISQLKSAQIKTVMCTGDNPLTAVSVAKKCGMINNSTRVYTGVFEEQGRDEQILRWKDLDLDLKYLDDHLSDIQSVKSKPSIGHAEEFVLAVTGDVFTWVINNGSSAELIRMLRKGQVFARMSPEEKQTLVEKLRGIGWCVSFCGDGANDCGALKAADVGVSLSEAEASVAAPFTSKIMDISCVIDVIREGRAALVTSFSCFNFMALYSMIQFATVFLLYFRAVTLGNWQFLFIDLIIILSLATTMGQTKPYPTLSVKKPTASLISTPVLTSLIGQILLQTLFQMFAFFLVRSQTWYKNYQQDGDFKCPENSALFIVSCFQYIFVAVVLSKGPPFREFIFKNVNFMINAAILLGFTIFFNFAPLALFFMDMVSLPVYFRWDLVVIGVVYLIVALAAEYYLFFWLSNAIMAIKKALRPKVASSMM